LRVKTQHHRLFVLRLETIPHYLCPEAARGTKLCDLFNKVVVRIEEERKPRSEIINVEADLYGGFDITDRVGKSECDLLGGRRACLSNVIAGDRDRIPIRNLFCTERKGVRDEPERRCRRKDVGSAGDVFL